MKHSYLFKIEIIDPQLRLDHVLLKTVQKRFPEFSRNRLKSWFEENKVHLSSRPIKASTLLQPGAYDIQIQDLSEDAFSEPQASPSVHPEKIQIVFEDSELLVINKESGMPSVPHDSTETETAVGLALAHFPRLSEITRLSTQIPSPGGKKNLEPGLLHRLDTGTSGLLVFAKSQKEFTRLSQAWKNRQIRKIYRAWVSIEAKASLAVEAEKKLGIPAGFPYPLPLRVEHPLAHDAKSAKRMRVCHEASRAPIRGKPLPAITHVLSIQAQKNQRRREDTPIRVGWIPQLFDLEIKIETGVMHQIRCHLAHLKTPILGDTIYHGLDSSRLWLHAWRLSLPSADGKQIELQAPLPELWQNPDPIKFDKK